MQRFAIYDLDRTITRVATFPPFLVYAARRIAPLRLILMPLLLFTSLLFALGLVGRARLKEINLGIMLGGNIPADRLAAVSRGFAGRTLARNCRAQALERIAADRAEGRTVIIASASYAFYVDELGELLGADAVVATRATEVPSGVRPAIVGGNCFGDNKLAMVLAWFEMRGIDRAGAHVRFYSDHASDLPCFEWADEAVAANPHGKMRAIARVRGWPVEDWR